MKRKWLLVSLCVCLVVGIAGIALGTRTAPVAHEPPVVPLPPKATALAGTGPAAQQASSLATEVAQRSSSVAAWLSVYNAAGIPVIAADGASLTETDDDPIGPRFWQIWYAAATDMPKRGIRLSDLGRVLLTGRDGDPSAVATRLLREIRAGKQSRDAQTQFISEFVRSRVLSGASHVDLMDPTATPESIVIDPATAQLLSWVIFRGVVFRSYSNSPPTTKKRAGLSFDLIGAAHAESLGSAAMPPCHPVFNSNETDRWVAWLQKRLIKGTNFAGLVKIPGLIDLLVNPLGDEAGKEMARALKNFHDWGNFVTASIALLERIASLQVSAEQLSSPLIRTKSMHSDGQTSIVQFVLTSKPDMDSKEIHNCLLELLEQSFGFSFKLSTEGPLSDTEMKFFGRSGFPDLVRFVDADQMKKTTDSRGVALVKVIGNTQKKEIAASAKPVKKSFSILVEAQPAPVGGSSMINMFFAGFTVLGAPTAALPAGAVNGGKAANALLEPLKFYHYSMGEYEFELRDWQHEAFAIRVRNNISTYAREAVADGTAQSEIFDMPSTGDSVTVTVKTTTNTAFKADRWCRHTTDPIVTTDEFKIKRISDLLFIDARRSTSVLRSTTHCDYGRSGKQTYTHQVPGHNGWTTQFRLPISDGAKFTVHPGGVLGAFEVELVSCEEEDKCKPPMSPDDRDKLRKLMCPQGGCQGIGTDR